MIMYFMGKRVDEMTKDELLEVVRVLGEELNFYRQPGIARAIALGEGEKIKRGEGRAA